MRDLPPGIYPMLYAFFDESGRLRQDAFVRQVDAALAAGVAGVAILGLATEVKKLTPEERRTTLDAVARRLDGRAPLLVTVFGDTAAEQIAFARRAADAGASALLLQPPPVACSDDALRGFFAEVIAAVDCPTGIQNAPEFIGYGLSDASLRALARDHANFTLAKLECSATALAEMVAAIGGRVAVFNGRCGLELPDNLRGGARGLIPSIETADRTTEIYHAFAAGDEARAERLYAALCPALAFMMQGIAHLLTYGKAVAAARLGIAQGGFRAPYLAPSPFGMQAAARFADRLGPLAH